MCKKKLSPKSFYKDKTRKDGLSGRCKSCMKEQNNNFWLTHTTVVVLRTQVERVKEFIRSL